jgi:hypothetical protein
METKAKLELEQGTQGSPDRIGSYGRIWLNMGEPQSSQIRYK